MSLNITPEEIVSRAEATGSSGLLGRKPGWPRVPLGQLVRITNGAPFPSSGFNRDGLGPPLVRIRDVGLNQPTTYYSGDFDEAFRVEPGDLLVGMDGDFRTAIWSGPRALLNQRVCRLSVADARLDGRWLRHILQGYLDAIWKETSSVTVKHLSSKSIAAIPLPLPPIEEQRRIVDTLEDHLSRLDAADALLRQGEGRLAALTRAVLGAVSADASTSISLSELVERIEAGKSFGTAAGPATEDQWGIIKVSAMTWGEFRPEENKAVTELARVDPTHEIRVGDLLVSRANTTEYVGAPVLVRATRPKLLLSDKSLRLVPRSGWDPEYLLLLLSAPSARAQISALATGTKDSMRNISQRNLLSIRVPELAQSEQPRVVANVRGAIEAEGMLFASLRHARERARALRMSLLAAAFRGQLTPTSLVVERLEEEAGV